MMSEPIPLSDEQMDALRAYSEGKIGWRAAGKELPVLNHQELADLLYAYGLPDPAEEDSPIDEAAVERFSSLLRGEA